MTWANDGEVTAVERRQSLDTEPLAGGHDRGVENAERQVTVLLEQIDDACPIEGLDRLDQNLAVTQGAGKRLLRRRADATTEEVGDLGDDERRDDQRA